MNSELIKTREQICNYIGEHRNDFTDLVENRGLPAWRSKPRGTWKALKESLNTWLMKQEEIYLKNR